MLNKNTNIIIGAYVVSATGSWLYRLAIPLLIYQITQSALQMSVIYACEFLPILFATPLGGVIADQANRLKLLRKCNLLAAAITFLLGIIFLLYGHATTSNLAVIYLLVIALASVTAFYHPIIQSYLPEIVSKNKLCHVNSLIISVDNFMLLAGPLFGGFVIAFIGANSAIFLNMLAYLISAILLVFISTRHNDKKYTLTLISISSDLKAGYYCLITNPVLKYACILFFFANFAINIFYANFMYFLVKLLSLPPNLIGVVITITGIGAIAGSTIASQANRYCRDSVLILLCIIGSGITMLLMLFSNAELWIACLWGIVSAFNSIIVVTYFTLRQQLIAAEFLGRTVALTRLISYAAIPIAAVIGGWILKYSQNMDYLILLSGVILLVTGLAGWLTPLGRHKPHLIVNKEN